MLSAMACLPAHARSCISPPLFISPSGNTISSLENGHIHLYAHIFCLELVPPEGNLKSSSLSY